MEELIKYKAFQNLEDFEEFKDILSAQNIQFDTEDYPINYIADKTNNNFNHEYVIKLKKDDFEKADKLQIEIAETEIKNVDPDYYLFDYSIDELRNIIKEKDAWNSFDVTLAMKILRDKGVELSEEDLAAMESERLTQLSEPDKKTSFWVTLGYLSAILGGIFGILIGTHLANHKRILPNGEKVFDYTESDRKHGKYILIISLIVILAGGLLRIIEAI